MQTLQEISLNDIVSSRYQPRLRFIEDEIRELAASIQEVGLLHPPVVSPILGTSKYEIVAGERRIMACRFLEMSHLVVVVKERPSAEKLAHAALIENVQRVDLNPIEIARSMKALIDEFSLSQEDLAQKIGKKRSTVANYLRLLQLSKEIQEALSEGKITFAHAKVLLSCPENDRKNLFQKMLTDRLTVQKATKIAKETSERCFYLKELEERLERHFSSRVKVDGGQKKGVISLHYYSLDDLDRILETLGVRES